MTENDPERAREELQRIPLDQETLAALQNPAHPGHTAATAHRRNLYAAAYADVDRQLVDGNNQDVYSDEQAFMAPPIDPKDYRFDPAPAGLSYDTALEQKARGWFHEAGVPQWLARNLAREWNRAIENPPDAGRVAQDAAATEKSLRRQWGDRYDAKIEAAQSMIRSLKDDEVADLLDRSGLANSEYLIRQLVALAESRMRR